MKKKEYDALERANRRWLDQELPPLEEIPEHEFSPEFQRKMDNLFQKERETARRRRRMGGLKQAAAVALVCLGVALGGISTAHALHIPIIQTMVSIVQNFTEYQFSASTSAPEAPLGAFSLTWLPEGLEEVSRQEIPTQYVVEWRGEGEFLVLEQQRITPDTVSVYGAGDLGARVTRFMLRGAEAVGREKGENTSVFWTDGCFFYLLSSSLPLEDLRQIAESMTF